MNIIYFDQHISFYNRVKFLFYRIKYLFNRKKKKKKIKKLRNKILINIVKMDKIVIPPQGLGDILYILLSFRKREEKIKNIVVCKRHFLDLILLFSDIVENVVLVKKEDMHTIDKYTIGKKYSFSDIYLSGKAHYFLELFEKTFQNTIDRDNIPLYCNDDFFIKKYSDHRKIILICPEATTCPKEILDEYWIKYAEKLVDLGYYPVFNSQKQYGKYQSVFWNIKTMIEFANFSGYVIGYRSGLIDVLCYFTKAKFIVIYPNKLASYSQSCIFDFNISPEKKYMDFCSLKRINPGKNVQEVLFDRNTFPIFDDI